MQPIINPRENQSEFQEKYYADDIYKIFCYGVRVFSISIILKLFSIDILRIFYIFNLKMSPKV